MFNTIASILESFVIAFFLLFFNGGRRKPIINYLGTIVAGLGLTASILVTTKNTVFSEYTTFIDFIILFIYASFFLNFKWYFIIGSIILCYSLMIALTMFSAEFVHIFFNIEFAQFAGQNNIYTVWTTIISRLLWILILASLLYLKRTFKLRKTSLFETLIITATGIVTIICANLVFMIIRDSGNLIAHEIVLFLIFLLVLDGLICGLLILFAQQKKKNMELTYLNKSISDQRNTYSTLLIQVEDLRKQKHNIKNALMSLSILEKNKQYNDLQNAIQQTINVFAHQSFEASVSENTMWVAIIDHKKQIAAQKNICFSLDIDPGDYSGVKSIDLCILLGNLIDNAIEASSTEPDHKNISLSIRNEFGIIYISIKNFISNSILQNNPSLASTKGDPDEHGFGLLTVRELVSEYNGDIRIYEEDSYFCINIMLFPKNSVN